MVGRAGPFYCGYRFLVIPPFSSAHLLADRLPPARNIVVVNFGKDRGDILGKFPIWIVRLKFTHVADIPDVIAHAIAILVGSCERLARDRFADLNCLQHGTVAKATAANVVYLARTGIAIELIERLNQVVRVNVVTHLLALISKHRVGQFGHGALHQVRQKTMQLGTAVIGARQTPAAKGSRLHTEVLPVLLHQNIGRYLRSAEQAVHGMVDRHILANAVVIDVGRIDFPASFVLDQRQTIGRIAVDFIGRRENKDRVRAELASAL